MKSISVFASIGALLVLCSPGQSQSALENARNQNQSGQAYAYQLEHRSSDFSLSAQVNPTAPAGRRVGIVSPPKNDWNDDLLEFVRELDKEAGEFIWCAQFLENVPGNAQLVRENGNSATYRFKPIPDKKADADERKFLKSMLALVRVGKDRPGIVEVEMSTTQPISHGFMASISRYDLKASCSYAPDGRTYVTKMENVIAGSAMGQEFSDTRTTVISNIQALN